MQFSVFLFIYNRCCIHEVNIRMEDFGTFCVCLHLNMYTTKPRIEQETLYHLTLSSLLHQHRMVTPTSSFLSIVDGYSALSPKYLLNRFKTRSGTVKTADIVPE